MRVPAIVQKATHGSAFESCDMNTQCEGSDRILERETGSGETVPWAASSLIYPALSNTPPLSFPILAGGQ